MSFYEVLEQFEHFDVSEYLAQVTPADVERAISKDRLSWQDFLALLSETALAYLEPMAQRARQLTIQYFGRTIQLFIPLYISN